MQAAIAEAPAPVAPLVKWVGGKGAMVDAIMRAMPATFGTYYEPFAGGAAVAFALEAHHGSHPIVLGDVNGDLIHAYRMVRREPERVVRRLRWMQSHHGPTFYAHVRREWNDHSRRRILGEPALETPSMLAVQSAAEITASVRRAAAFLYLNRTCFNALWRVNRRGDFNVPMGDYKNPAICDPQRIAAAAAALERATLVAASWQQTIANVKPGDLVFLDPPYVPRSATSSFTSYTVGGFGDPQQVELAAAAALLVDAGVHVLATNNDVRRVRELYAGPRWRRRRVMMSRSISSRGDGRGDVAELLIVGRP